MMKKLWRLILIQVLLLAAISAGAANDFAHPMIMSGNWEHPTLCKLVTVYSLTQVNGQIFSQNGVGWVLQGDEGLRVLTPSHVVAGADLILGECKGQVFQMNVQSRTETRDLALLTPLAPMTQLLFPAILFRNRATFLAQADQAARQEAASDNPDHFAQPLDQVLLRQVLNYYLVPGRGGDSLQYFKSFEHDVAADGLAHFQPGLNSLVAETLAIRPGYSGSPLLVLVPVNPHPMAAGYISYDAHEAMQSYLTGMLTKVEVNGSRSLGISLPDILKVMPLLWQSNNPDGDAFADANKGSPRLRYRHVLNGKVLERQQELLVTLPTGEQKVLKEICDDATVESSQWDTPAQNGVASDYKDLKNSNADSFSKSRLTDDKLHLLQKDYLKDLQKSKSIEQKSGGGDYGEGGGSAQTLKDSILMSTNPTSGLGMMVGNLASYKKKTSCTRVLVQDTQGQVYDSMTVQGRLQKVTSLAEAYDALSSGVSATAAGPSCQVYNLRFGDDSETLYNMASKKYFYQRSEGMAQAIDAHAVEALAKKEDGSFLRCYQGGPLMELQFQYPLGVSMHLVLGDPQKAQGSIQLRTASGSCQIPVSSSNYTLANRWKHQIRSSQADIDILLGTSGRIVSIKILRTSPECTWDAESNGFGPWELWMNEFNFSDPVSLGRAFRPQSWVGNLLAK